ncbi:hypothetical protein PR048_011674 [Dryococelus australis]|uniref:Uncharacterized protein n=1 Tax=Dryococelus australis TaxID=614101 RepID=A0ABQ9HMC7_9NEOP|nr:hypothetical protein PR048_011674 [Dryococelus australis]
MVFPKALNLTNLEKQNVKLCSASEYVTAALSELGEKRILPTYKGTKAYIEIILRWWKIMNVKHPNKGTHLKDMYMQPLTLSPCNGSIGFLENMLVWMEPLETGKLSRETHLALTQTTHAILELAKYCMAELNFSYSLPVKIQTDPLEERFGKYRILAGSQHYISVRQVIECEAKLRLQDSLPLKLRCNARYSGLVSDKYFDSSHSLIKELDRGGLQYPHPDVASIVVCVYAVMLKLIVKPYEQEFLNTGNHKQVLVMITTAQLKEELSHLDVCDAGHLKKL